MASYLILARSACTAETLKALLAPLVSPEKWHVEIECVLWVPHLLGRQQSAIQSYEALVHKIEQQIPPEATTSERPVVFVDSVQPSLMNPLTDGDQWESLIAMLILTFPDVHWIFGAIVGVLPEAFPASHHSLCSLYAAPRDCLFDPTGLRDFIRKQANRGLVSLGDDLTLPLRPATCASIDEESNFAYFHGYTAYRFGLRSDVVTAWALMYERFQRGDVSHRYWLLLEDMSLSFPDRPSSVSLLRLEDRAKVLSGLDSLNGRVESSAYRVLITTGQTRRDGDCLAANETYLNRKATGQGFRIFKPAAGMFDLWWRLGVAEPGLSVGRCGNAPGFEWPQQTWNSSVRARGHGCPGKLMLIAQKLLHRAEELGTQVSDVVTAVRGAVFSTDALELTGGRTPTTAVEALSLKHRFELLAECQFSGIEHHISTDARLREINSESTAIGQWFHPEQRQRATRNAEMRILSALVRLLREYHLFDEEQTFMAKTRRLHNSLWMAERRWRLIMWPILRYLELLLSSFPAFVFIVLVWVVVLSVLFNQTSGHPYLPHSVTDAMTSFFSVGAPIHATLSVSETLSPAYVWVICLAVFAGALHLGVLISHVYAIASRR